MRTMREHARMLSVTQRDSDHKNEGEGRRTYEIDACHEGGGQGEADKISVTGRAEIPFLSWILAVTLSMVSEEFESDGLAGKPSRRACDYNQRGYGLQVACWRCYSPQPVVKRGQRKTSRK